MEYERRPVKKALRESADLVHDGNNNLSLLAPITTSPSGSVVNLSMESSASSDGEAVDRSQEMVVPVSPSMVDIDSLESQSGNLFCLFCPTIFTSKFDAFSPYFNPSSIMNQWSVYFVPPDSLTLTLLQRIINRIMQVHRI